ncbi:hypothetical protein BV20DRAFT_1110019 [Pilatotrama ljubarskyi]|nr:hypothetical protein BV20DRAFT_1110019 [Pilatotrama ljubarskyi]
MDRLRDYSFLSDYTNDHLHPSSTTTHVSPSQPFSSMAQALSAPSTHFDYHLPSQVHNMSTERGVHTLEFRLPLIAPTLGFAPESKPGASRICHSMQPSHLPTNFNNFPTGQVGLATYSQPSSSLSATFAVPVSVPISVPWSYRPASRDLAGDRTSSLGYPPGAPRPGQPQTTTSSLLLEDICHLEPLDDLPSAVASVLGGSDPLAPGLHIDQAYSDCPAAEFSPPTWTLPPSLPSLSYGSFSASGSNVAASPKKEHLDDFLCFSPSPGPAGGDAFGSAPLLGIYADVNMRELEAQGQSPPACVNPADIMGDMSGRLSPSLQGADSPMADSPRSRGSASPGSHGVPLSDSPGLVDRQLSQTPDHTSTADFAEEAIGNDFPDDAIFAIVSVLKDSVKHETQETSSISAGGALPPQSSVKPCELVAPQPLYPNQIPTYGNNVLGLHHPSLAAGSSRLAFPGPRVPLADLQLQQIQPIQVPPYGPYAPFGLPSGFGAPPPAFAPPPSPVLNAHTGIELDDLRQRATEFRTRNPGMELDRAFLQSFAGRLSARGELLDEYRCYVIGCGQRNKRRDHILVHVGSHVEHRPWQCQHCGMRFLRKNECKRHESSHEGRKPFSCPICAPFQERNFVRQDLLKRHMRVTHGVQTTPRALAGAKQRVEARKDENMERWT